MEEEILDLEEQNQPKKLFSILSVIMAVINLSLGLFVTFSAKIFSAEASVEMIVGLVKILAVSIFLGAIFSIIGIVQKEKIKYFNFTAKTVNIVFFILLLWIIITNSLGFF